MNIIQRIALCSLLIVFVAVKHGSCNRDKVGGYVPELSGMPPINVTNCQTPEILKNPSLSNALECARTCHVGEKPKTCYYKFVLERYPVSGQACNFCTPNVTNMMCPNCQCIVGDGVERMALTVNRMMPGPSIQLCLHDYAVIDVVNKIKEDAVSIHWHGVYQKNFQYCDGVPELTQCPITVGTVFRYQFRVKNSGTHFWHAHSGLNKMDGIFGSFIVRDPIEQDPHSHLYDYDLANHVIVVNDWMHEEATERFPGRDTGTTTQAPDTFLINGKGKLLNSNITAGNSSFEVITVEPNKRYRFRLINSFCTVCPGQLMIEGHKMTVIASDGQSNKPVVVDAIVSLPGERYDFIIHTNQEPGAYWIQLRGVNACKDRGVHQLAILQYTNAPTKPRTSQPSYDSLPSKVILNPVENACNKTTSNAICISNLTHALSVDSGIVSPEPDLKFYMPIGFRTFAPAEFYQPNTYNTFLVPIPNNVFAATMDNIQFTFPPSPPISQLDDLPPDQFCNSQNLPRNCDGNCTCTHVLKIPLNAVVEMILIDISGAPNINHPFHLHGHSFNVLSMDQPLGPSLPPARPISVDYVKKLEKKTNLQKRFDNPAGKDTITLPNNGYAVIRFRANNPGFWLFHCHFVYHQDVGMELVFNVGDRSDLPPVPKNFPRCGHYKPDIKPDNYNKYKVDKGEEEGEKEEKEEKDEKEEKKEWKEKEEKEEKDEKEEKKEWKEKEEKEEKDEKEEKKEWKEREEKEKWEEMKKRGE